VSSALFLNICFEPFTKGKFEKLVLNDESREVLNSIEDYIGSWIWKGRFVKTLLELNSFK
jgi:hypothetical protein